MSAHVTTGGCSCGEVTYCIHRAPLIVHACHCRNCQIQTGSSNALNALIEHSEIEHLSGELIYTEVATPSGAGQTIARCHRCFTALWSYYHHFPAGRLVAFVRVGTLQTAEAYSPDVHIYTTTMHARLTTACLEIPCYEGFYNIRKVWTRQSLSRLEALKT